MAFHFKFMPCIFFIRYGLCCQKIIQFPLYPAPLSLLTSASGIIQEDVLKPHAFLIVESINLEVRRKFFPQLAIHILLSRVSEVTHWWTNIQSLWLRSFIDGSGSVEFHQFYRWSTVGKHGFPFRTSIMFCRLLSEVV